jgi:hypothetical protein
MAASPAVLNRNQVGGSPPTNITARRRSFFADLAGISPPGSWERLSPLGRAPVDVDLRLSGIAGFMDDSESEEVA